MNSWKFSFLIISSISTALAGDVGIQIPQSLCSDVDVRDNMNQKMKDHFSSPRSQDGIGWCYGFAAADLVSAELGESVSSTHASLIYNEGVEDSFFMKMRYKISRLFDSGGAFDEVYEGGFIKRAVKNLSKTKVCKEEDLPFDHQYRGQTKNSFIKALENAKKHMDRGETGAACGYIQDTIDFNGLGAGAEEIFLALQDHNLNSSLMEVANLHCADRMLDVPKLKVKKIRSPRLRRGWLKRKRGIERLQRKMEKYFNTIDSALTRGKPMGIEYDVKSVTRQEGGHASVVTARRWRNGRCEFKIRNSWGKGCSMYDPREITGCDYNEGSFWVSDQKFYEMARNLSYIDN